MVRNTHFTTELLDSPFEAGKSIPIRTFKKLAVSALNDTDLIISKMFRGTSVDVEDCLTLMNARGAAFDLAALKARFEETALYDLMPEKMMKHLQYLLNDYKPGGEGA